MQRDEQACLPLCALGVMVPLCCSQGSFLPADPEDTLLESVKELRAVVSNLAVLSSRIQELEQSEFRALQMEM